MAIIRIGSQAEYQRAGVSAQANPISPGHVQAMPVADGLADGVMKAAAKVGGDWLGIVARGYREAQVEKVDDALLNVERKFTEWKDEYERTRQGRDAATAAGDFTKRHEELAAEAVKELDGEEDEIFNDLLRRRLAQQNLHALKEGASYGQRQEEAYRQSQWLGQMASFQRLAESRPEDGDAIELEAQNLLASWQAKNPGKDPTAIRMQIEDMAMTRRLDTLLAQKNPQAAQAVLRGSAFGNAALRKGGTIAEDLCNPLNLKKVGHGGGKREDFEAFATDGDGFRAALRQLKIYKDGKRQLKTPAEMIKVWAPPSDGNNYEKYLQTVAKVSGLDLNSEINLDDPGQAARLLRGMASMEGPLGKRYSEEQIAAMLSEKGGKVERRELASADGGLGALKAARYQQAIDDMLKSQALEQGQALRLPIDDYLARCRQGIVSDWPADAAAIRAAFGDKAEGILRQMSRESQYALDAQAMSRASLDEQRLLLEARRPDADDEAFAEKQAIYERLQRLAQEDQKQRKQDPGQYILSHDDKARQAAAELLRNLTPESWRAYRAEMNMGMLKRGMDMKILPILGERLAQSLAEKVGFADNPARAMSQLAQAMGGDFEKAAPLLAPKLGNTALLLASGISEEAAGQIMQARRNPDFLKQADAQLFSIPADKQAFEVDLNEELSDIMKTFSAAGNEGMAASIRENAGIYARKLMLTQGLDADDAIKKAASQVINERYEIARSPSGSLYRIPKEIAQSQDNIPDLADAWLDKLELDSLNVTLPGRLDPVRKKRALRQILKNNVSWITSPDESGLVPFLQGQPLAFKNGGLVSLKWHELKEEEE